MPRLVLVVALLAAPALAQPADDPPPTTAELAPGLVLTLDWTPFVFSEHDAVYEDGSDWPATLDGCATWLGYDGLPSEDESDGVTLAAAALDLDGTTIDLPTGCVIDFGPGAPAEAFDLTRGALGLIEVSAGISDGAGTATLGWVVGPTGAVRFDAEGVGPLVTKLAGAQGAAERAHESLAQALAAAVAADRAAAEARRVMEARRAVAERARTESRRALTETADVLATLGVEVPAAPPEAGPLALSACAVTPDSTARVEPGAAVTLGAEAVGAGPVVAWVVLGDGASNLVVAEDGAIRVPHVYAYAGTYRATVTAYAPDGSASCAVEVTVGDGEDPFCADVTELNPVYFGPFGRADLEAEAEARVAENVELLQRCPSLCVRVIGYADDTDTEAVSATRAEAVGQAYRLAGLAPDRVVTEGRGLGPSCNTFEDPGPGDQRCRRVESAPVACAEVR